MGTVAEIISAMEAAAPAGLADLDDPTLAKLRYWTAALLNATPDADEEYNRFLAIGTREIPTPSDQLRSWLGDANVLVVGGTGCVGSCLIRQLRRYRPRRVTSVSRGTRYPWPRQPEVAYRYLDIREREPLRELFAQVRPDIVFHLAGQRDPGLAEREVHRTVTTNVFGTRNVVDAAAAASARFLVYSSTGKAMRPYPRDVYAATKRIAEFVASQAAGRDANSAAARFTHVVDNSIVHQRLCQPGHDRFFRMHGPDVFFYAQSATESSQLLLVAGLRSRPEGLRVNAIRDLGSPVSLLDFAVGALRRSRSGLPIYFSGFDRGYVDTVRPDLFDPATAGDVTPLFNRFEAVRTEPSSEATDMFTLDVAPSPQLAQAMCALERACTRTGDTGIVRIALDGASRALREASHEGEPVPPPRQPGAAGRAAVRER